MKTPQKATLDSREVLQQHSRWGEGDLGLVLMLFPVQDTVHVLPFNVKAVTLPDRGLEQHADTERQPL